MASSRTRARIRVHCIGRRILNHCATREVPSIRFSKSYLPLPFPGCGTLGKAPNLSVPPVKEEGFGDEVGAEDSSLTVGTQVHKYTQEMFTNKTEGLYKALG